MNHIDCHRKLFDNNSLLIGGLAQSLSRLVLLLRQAEQIPRLQKERASIIADGSAMRPPRGMDEDEGDREDKTAQ